MRTAPWYVTVTSAACGASVVVAVHYGRQWADGTCADPTDCNGDAVLQWNAFVAVVVPLAAVLMLTVLRVRRAWLLVPVAFVLQGVAMYVLEHTDGFWLPLWLDVCVGATSWAAAAGLKTIAGRLGGD